MRLIRGLFGISFSQTGSGHAVAVRCLVYAIHPENSVLDTLLIATEGSLPNFAVNSKAIMKLTNTLFTLLFTTVIASLSCKKDTQPPVQDTTPRKVCFVLYTSKDFSNDNGTITFGLRIGNAPHPIWDSVLAPMKIKDIPAPGNKWTIEKTFTGRNNADLPVAFLYTIENVGNSWHVDTMKAGNNLKTLEYDFQ